MKLPDKMTIGEAFEPAMKITCQTKATEYFEALVDRGVRVFSQTRAEAESAVRDSLGYFAGYYGSETRERVERLFACAHPIFGKIADNGSPTAAEAFKAGERAVMGK